MANLTTKYMGHLLNNSLIIGSSGLTNSVENVIEFENRGAKATAVQVVPTLYKNGFGHINSLLTVLETWIVQHNYSSINEFKGKMSFKNTDNPAAYLRVQFMKHYAEIE